MDSSSTEAKKDPAASAAHRKPGSSTVSPTIVPVSSPVTHTFPLPSAHFSCHDNMQIGASRFLVTNSIPASDDGCSGKTTSTADAHMKNVNGGMHVTKHPYRAKAITCQSDVADDAVSDKSLASSEGDALLALGDKAVMLIADEQASAVGSVPARNSTSVVSSAHLIGCSDAAQCYTDSVGMKSENNVLGGEKKSLEKVCNSQVDPAESQGIQQYDEADLVPDNTDYSHPYKSDQQDGSSCGLVIKEDEDVVEDEDVITLSEEYLLASQDVFPSSEDSVPSLVSSSVYSVTDDDFSVTGNNVLSAKICENGSQIGSSQSPSLSVHFPSTPPHPDKERVTESGNLSDTKRTSVQSADTPDRNTESFGEVGNSISVEFLKKTRNGDNSTECTSASRSSTQQQESEVCCPESLVVKLDCGDAGFENRNIHASATPDSCSQVRSVDSCAKNQPLSEVDIEEENTGRANVSAQHIVKTTYDGSESNSQVESNSDSVDASSSQMDNLRQRTGQSGALSLLMHLAHRADGPAQAGHQSETSVVSSTLSKSLIPSRLTAKKGITQMQSSEAKQIVLTLPSTLGGEKMFGALTTQNLIEKSQNIESQAASSDTDSVSNGKACEGTKVRRILIQQNPGSSPLQVSVPLCVPISDGSVKTYTVMSKSQQIRKPVSVHSAPSSSFVTEPSMIRASSAALPSQLMPVSVNSIIQVKDKKQQVGITSNAVSLSQSVPTVPVCRESVAASVPHRSVQLVCLLPPLTSDPSSRMHADSLVTASQTPVSTTQKPVPAKEAVSSESTSPIYVISRIPQVSMASKEDVTTHQAVSNLEPSLTLCSTTPSVSVSLGEAVPVHQAVSILAPSETSAGTTTGHSTHLIATPATVFERIAGNSKQHIRLDQVSADAKLSAGDMGTLIEGKSLVPSLEPRWQPGSMNSVYRCMECNILYSTLVGYTAHVKRMSMVVRYACMSCKAALVFFNRCTFLAHLRKHSTCSSTGEQVLNLKSRTMSVTSLPTQLLPLAEPQYTDPMIISRNRPVNCTECHVSCSDAKKLVQHFSSATHCTFEHACQHCNMQLPSVCALKAHLRLHDAEHHTFSAHPPYVCPECGLLFINQLSLYQHIYATCLHFNRCVDLKCFICRVWFPTVDSLEDHIFITHPSHNRYRCTVCRRTYNTPDTFSHHILHFHRKEREGVRFQIESSCASCCSEKDFIDGRGHAKKHVEKQLKQSQVRFSFICLLCFNCLAPSRAEMRFHLNQKHAAFRFTCSICQQGFVMLSLLRAHVLSAHSTKAAQTMIRGSRTSEERLIQCTQCSAAFSSAESPLPHVMWHVVKKVTELANPATDLPPSLQINKHSMDIAVPPITVKDQQTYFCRSCGHVLLSNLDLQQHLKEKKHFVCIHFPTCTYCQRFDFASMETYRAHLQGCGDVELNNMSALHQTTSEQMTGSHSGDACVSDVEAWQPRRNPAQLSFTTQNGQHFTKHSTSSSATDQARNSTASSGGVGLKVACKASTSPDEAGCRVNESNAMKTNYEPLTLESKGKLDNSNHAGAAPPMQSGKSSCLSNTGPLAKTAGEKSSSSGQTAQQGSMIATKTPLNSPHSKTIIIFTQNGKVFGHTQLENVPEDGKLGGNMIKHTVIKSVMSPKSASPSVCSPPKQVFNVLPSKEQGTETSVPVETSNSSATQSKEQEKSMPDNTEELTTMDTREDDCQPYHLCPMCGLAYESADVLASHRASAHRGQKSVLSCQLCEKKGKKVMLSRLFLRKHMVRRHKFTNLQADSMIAESAGQQTSLPFPKIQAPPVHRGSKRLFTDSESTCLSSQGGMSCGVKRLRLAEGGQQDYVCAKCPFCSPSRESFREHIRAHAVDGAVQCLECGLCFSTIASLKKHLLMVHKVRQPATYVEENNIRLDELPTHLVSHMNTLTPLGQPEVVIRTKRVILKSFHKAASFRRLDEEKKERKESSSLECNVCYKVFEHESALRSHMRNHGMAFIRSRRAMSRQEEGEKGSAMKESVQGPGDQQPKELRDCARDVASVLVDLQDSCQSCPTVTTRTTEEVTA